MRRLDLRLQDILEAIANIEAAAARGEAAFLADPYLQVWIIHHLQLIGEAVRTVMDELVAKDPETPWPQIVAMRHILVHQYFGVELDDVWAVVRDHVPALRLAVEALVAKPSPEPTPPPEGDSPC